MTQQAFRSVNQISALLETAFQGNRALQKEVQRKRQREQQQTHLQKPKACWAWVFQASPQNQPPVQQIQGSHKSLLILHSKKL